MLIDVRTKIDTITSNILIWDCVHATFGHIMKMTPNTLKNMNLCMVRNCILYARYAISYSN